MGNGIEKEEEMMNGRGGKGNSGYGNKMGSFRYVTIKCQHYSKLPVFSN